jgi:hypothetical protein
MANEGLKKSLNLIEGPGLSMPYTMGYSKYARFPLVYAASMLALLAFSAAVFHGVVDKAKPRQQSTGPEVPTALRKFAGNSVQIDPSFELNQGQAADDVRFISRARDYVLFLTDDGAVLELQRASQTLTTGAAQAHKATPVWLRMRLVGSNSQPNAVGRDLLPQKTNWFKGGDSSHWQIGIKNYARVSYPEIYPGVELVYHTQHSQLEHDFILAPGADAKEIVWEVQDVAGSRPSLSIDSNGDLLVHLGDGVLRLAKPLGYEFSDVHAPFNVNHHERLVDVRYMLKSSNQFAFTLAPHDASKGLVIDPLLEPSTYIGGNQDDQSAAIAVDSSGNTYITGQTLSANYPTTAGAPQTTYSSCPSNSPPCPDVFVTKLDPSGSSLVYSTFLGGKGSDIAAGIAVDSAGNAYITGQTDSPDFPVTPGSYQTTCPSCSASFPLTDAFVTKLNASGALGYSTFLGGTGADQAYAIATDSSGNAYVVGATSSTDFPMQNPLPAPNNSLRGTQNAFVSELDPTGAILLASTYLGGGSTDTGYGIAVDSTGIYVTGQTDSNNFPTVNAVQSTFAGIADAFLSKLAPGGSSLIYSTYLGGTQNDGGTAVAVDSSGNAYITGTTASKDFPISPGAFQSVYAGGGSDAFVTEVNPQGSKIVYSTFLGGSDLDGGNAIAVDSSGTAVVVGGTASTNFPLANSVQSMYAGNTDAFLTRVVPGGCGITLSTYLGGNDTDIATGVALDSSGNAYLTGRTRSNNFPLGPNPYQGTTGGNFDAFVTRLNNVSAPAVCFSANTLTFPSQTLNSTSTAQTLTLTNGGTADLSITTIAATGDYGQTNTCGSSLAVAANCTVSVTFSPTSSGPRSGTITVTDNAGGSPQSVALAGTGTDFGMSVSPPTATVTSGGSASYTLTLTPLNGFNSTVDLSCSGAPASGSCTFSSNSVSFSSGATAKVTVTVATTPTTPTQAFLDQVHLRYPLRMSAVLLPFGIGFVMIGSNTKSWKRKWLSRLLLIFVLSATIVWPACGFKTNTIGNYSVTLTGKDGSLQHSTAVTFTVQ